MLMTSMQDASKLTQIELVDRVVVLARTLDASIGVESSAGALDRECAGDTYIGQALYEHRTTFRDASPTPAWSHLELTYFRDFVPVGVIRRLVLEAQEGLKLLRAEILVTTPSSFVLPRGWRGSRHRPEWQASLEYIEVQPRFLAEYRDVMQSYCGPAAAQLVRTGRLGTFRAMETVAVLHQDPGVAIAWNQLHLSEFDPTGFGGFGREFEAAIRELSPNDTTSPGVFADLDRLRVVGRWTFNHAVIEDDEALAGERASR